MISDWEVRVTEILRDLGDPDDWGVYDRDIGPRRLEFLDTRLGGGIIHGITDNAATR
jgi:hypothetical protein